MPWIVNEDAALKLKLQGLTVADANNPVRPVPVRYRLPEDELATLSYPIIIIEHLPMNFAPERAHSAQMIQLYYAPEGLPQWWAQGATSFDPTQSPYISLRFPEPVNMDYRVTVYTRKFPQHLQPILAQLSQDQYLPFKYAFLNVPQDGTIRNVFLLGGPEIEYGKDKDDKRLFRASYMIRVMSEIVPTVYINGIYNALVNQINLNLAEYQDVTNITTQQILANQALISTGPTVAFNVGLSGPPLGGSGKVQPLATVKIPRRYPSRAVWR